MNRGQLRKEVRRILQEPLETTASLWTDEELNDYLNEAAVVMTSEAQPIQDVCVLLSVQGQQEYPLPPQVHEIYSISFQHGNSLQPLTPVNPRVGSEYSRYLGIPCSFYVRAMTPNLNNRATTGLADVDPIDSQNSKVHSMVLGLSPLPQSTGNQIVIQFYADHFVMTNDLDVPIIPVDCQRGLIAYAVAIAKQKEQAYGEITTVYMPQFQEFMSRLKKKNIDRGIQMRGRHKAYVPDQSPRDEYATNVVFLPWQD